MARWRDRHLTPADRAYVQHPPSSVKALWDCHGRRWVRNPDRVGHWMRGGETVAYRALQGQLGPLSTKPPPAGTEPEVLCGCGAPILRPHRRGEPGCEGAKFSPAGTEGEQHG